LVQKIDRDHLRFRDIVRGSIKKELRKHITRGEMIGRQGKDIISIPIAQVDIPHFRYGSRGNGGVGQGDGDVGTPLGPTEGEPGQGAGDQPGEHILEVEVSLDELARLLGEELELPRIEPRGKRSIKEEKDRYTGIRQTGPESLRHFKRTYKRALRRQIASSQYDALVPIVIPIREDKLYRSWKTVERPEANAVVIYMMDVSGSMTDEQKEIVRIESFWIDTWLQAHYPGLETRYIVHDAEASEVDRERFYRTRESGGTRISSAYRLCDELVEERYPPEDWNIYIFHFSDGDNWGDDNAASLEILYQKLLPRCNLFCYGQVESRYGSGQFLRELKRALPEQENVVLAEIPDRDAIYDSIKAFLGRGK
jgi:sporulation protein YhbH